MTVHAFTIIPETWESWAEGLAVEDPRQLLNALRTALYAGGAAQANGWMIAFIHGEYDPIDGIFRIHVHGFACGEMAYVVDWLRKLPNYKTELYPEDGGVSPVYRRVRMTWKKLNNLPAPITYRLQSYWPAKANYISDDGSRTRAKRKRRIAEPHHSQVLLWQDKWKIEDLTLMIGLRVTKAGLKQTKPVS